MVAFLCVLTDHHEEKINSLMTFLTSHFSESSHRRVLVVPDIALKARDAPRRASALVYSPDDVREMRQ